VIWHSLLFSSQRKTKRNSNEIQTQNEATPSVNTKNYKRYEKQFYSCHSLRKEKAWHVLFLYLERRMRGWWD
jgi:hypothetical protein